MKNHHTMIMCFALIVLPTLAIAQERKNNDTMPVKIVNTTERDSTSYLPDVVA